MVKKQRRQTAAYKFRVALKALKASKAIRQLSSAHEIHANLIRAWETKLPEDGPGAYYNYERPRQSVDFCTLAAFVRMYLFPRIVIWSQGPTILLLMCDAVARVT